MLQCHSSCTHKLPYKYIYLHKNIWTNCRSKWRKKLPKLYGQLGWFNVLLIIKLVGCQFINCYDDGMLLFV